jgi:hypothetical protein
MIMFYRSQLAMVKLKAQVNQLVKLASGVPGGVV